ncbi:unnamed protein product [Sphagnum tenellum]
MASPPPASRSKGARPAGTPQDPLPSLNDISLPPIDGKAPTRPSSSKSSRALVVSPRKSQSLSSQIGANGSFHGEYKIDSGSSNGINDEAKAASESVSTPCDEKTQRTARKTLYNIYHSLSGGNMKSGRDIMRDIDALSFPEVVRQICIQCEALQHGFVVREKRLLEEIDSLKASIDLTKSSPTSPHRKNLEKATVPVADHVIDKDDSHEVGDLIQARFRGAPFYYPGFVSNVTVIKETGERLYDITYDDGELETEVPSNLIIKITAFNVGASVRARENKGPHYVACTITRIDETGSKFDLRYENGNIELGVEVGRIKHLNKEFVKSRMEENVRRKASVPKQVPTLPIAFIGTLIREESKTVANRDSPFQMGTKVKCAFGKGSIRSNAKVARVNGDGTFVIAYDDGLMEYAVPEARLEFIRDPTQEELLEALSKPTARRSKSSGPSTPRISGNEEKLDGGAESKFSDGKITKASSKS